jgi:hypothetical protein
MQTVAGDKVTDVHRISDQLVGNLVGNLSGLLRRWQLDGSIFPTGDALAANSPLINVPEERFVYINVYEHVYCVYDTFDGAAKGRVATNTNKLFLRTIKVDLNKIEAVRIM